MAEDLYTPGRRLAELARVQRERAAVILARSDGSEQSLSFAELHSWSNRLAHRLARAGVRQGSFVAIHLPNCVEHFVGTWASYKLGACPMPLGVKLPAPERDALLRLCEPAAILSDAPELKGVTLPDIRHLISYPDSDLPDVIPQPYKAIASGGSTGKPKLIVALGAFNLPVQGNPFAALLRLVENDLLYSPGPLYHNQPYFLSQVALFMGGGVVINERFDAVRALDLIEKHRPQVVSTVPTMLQRMLRVADVRERDYSAIRLLWHMAAPCPEWVKRGWIELLGPDKVWELWGATEMVGASVISGEEWLRRPGSVGRGFNTEFKIVDENGELLPPGQVGEIFTRFLGKPPNFAYLGSEPAPAIADDFTSVGDLGYLDEDGYLFLADRRTDLIITGGANVYPAEVESVLSEHPSIGDVVVVGLSDDDLGRRVHAVIEPLDGVAPPTCEELDQLVRSRLAPYKVPRSYEFIARLPRDESGKIRRRALRDVRDSPQAVA